MLRTETPKKIFWLESPHLHKDGGLQDLKKDHREQKTFAAVWTIHESFGARGRGHETGAGNESLPGKSERDRVGSGGRARQQKEIHNRSRPRARLGLAATRVTEERETRP